MSRKMMKFHDNQNTQNVESMKHCNNHLQLLNDIKEIQKKEREAWKNTNRQDENGLHWVILKKVGAIFFTHCLWQIAWIKVVCAQNHLVCDVTIILSVKE